jgi:prophage regulatory protein
MQNTPGNRTLRPAQAAEKLGIGLSTIWLKAKSDPKFPKPFKISPRTTVFYEQELDAYIAACAQSRGPACKNGAM